MENFTSNQISQLKNIKTPEDLRQIKKKIDEGKISENDRKLYLKALQYALNHTSGLNMSRSEKSEILKYINKLKK